jgi:tetratricopeptide (TPR) repeat protein
VEAANQADLYAPLVLVIDGMPGVGKTSLVVRAAHELAPHYPDGQLFIDLHGHSEHRPAEPAQALDAMLRQLGVPAARIPTDLDERIVMWRSELVDRRVLLVLDNAATAAQVAPLLPPSPGCLALVTSRRLLDLDGARPRSLDLLDPSEAVALLERVAGERVRAEPDAAAEVAKRCGYLPLALRLAAARLGHRSHWRVRDLADRLADSRAPLTELATGDRTVADAFGLSYAQLSPAAQRMFRLLGLHPGDSFDAYAAAALANVALGDAGSLLDELVDTHLVHENDANRYRLHDLLRAYAAGLVHAVEPENDRRAAIEHLLDYYFHGAATASRGIETAANRRSFSPGEPQRPDLIECNRWSTGWLSSERTNLLAVVRCASENGYEQYAWQIARATWRFLYTRGHMDDLVEAHRHGLDAAERLGDGDAAAVTRNYLASAYVRIGRCEEAARLVRKVILHRQAARDRFGEAIAWRNLAAVYLESSNYTKARDACGQALGVARKSPDPYLDATLLLFLGDLHRVLGQHNTALAFARRALVPARMANAPNIRAMLLANIGHSRSLLGQPEVALRLLFAALRAKRKLGYRYDEGETLTNIAIAHRLMGRSSEAVSCHRQALTVMREVGSRAGECDAYNELGVTLRKAGDTVGALEVHQRALDGAIKIRHKHNEARALDGIAGCLRDTDPELARRHWLRALQLYRELDVPERHEVERHLAELASRITS